MKQHFKGIIWPRGEFVNDTITKPVYRYVIVGMIVTDEPIEKFEGKNEILLDGPVNELVEPIITIKSRKLKFKPGDASSVLLNLNHM